MQCSKGCELKRVQNIMPDNLCINAVQANGVNLKGCKYYAWYFLLLFCNILYQTASEFISCKICLLLYNFMWAVFWVRQGTHSFVWEKNMGISRAIWPIKNSTWKERASPLNVRLSPTLPKRHQQRYSEGKQKDKRDSQ